MVYPVLEEILKSTSCIYARGSGISARALDYCFRLRVSVDVMYDLGAAPNMLGIIMIRSTKNLRIIGQI